MRKFVFLISLSLIAYLLIPHALHAETLEEIKARLRAEVREEYSIPKGATQKEQLTKKTVKETAGPEGDVLGIPQATFFKLMMIMFILGLLPATIAKLKRRSFIAWWVLGFLCFIVTFPASVFIKKIGEESKSKIPDKASESHPDKEKQEEVPQAEEETLSKDSAPGSPALEIYEKIEKLSSLKAKGIITEEEFESKKKELLDRI